MFFTVFFVFLIESFSNFSKGKFETYFKEIPILLIPLTFILFLIKLNSLTILLFKTLLELLFLLFKNKLLFLEIKDSFCLIS